METQLDILASERGVTVKELVSQTLKESGSVRQAAKNLGVSYTVIQWWLARNGYRVKQEGKLVKAESAK